MNKNFSSISLLVSKNKMEIFFKFSEFLVKCDESTTHLLIKNRLFSQLIQQFGVLFGSFKTAVKEGEPFLF